MLASAAVVERFGSPAAVGRSGGRDAGSGGALGVEEDAVALRVAAGIDRGLGLELEVAGELPARLSSSLSSQATAAA